MSAAGLLPDAVARIRDRRPLVHMITNLVTMASCAQAVRSVGAATIFAHDPREAAEVALTADAIVLNVGTSVPDVDVALLEVAKTAAEASVPVVLDPLGVGISRWRAEVVGRLVETGAVRAVSGNAAEVATLLGIPATMRGSDSESTAVGPEEIARRFARTGRVAALSGATDWVAGPGGRLAGVGNGHALMSEVVGTGSVRSAVLGAFVAVAGDGPDELFEAVLTGVAAYGVAGELAAARSEGPGGFFARLHDALAALTDGDVAAGARLAPHEGGHR